MCNNNKIVSSLERVCFRKWPCGIVDALFVDIIENRLGHIRVYSHQDQHSTADYQGVIHQTKPATPEEYQSIKSELESIGYNLEVIKRRSF